MGNKKNKYFTASNCIHLHACRKVTAIANRVIYGVKGTQKIARGCSKECPCYCTDLGIDACAKYALTCIENAQSQLSRNYEDFENTDDYQFIDTWLQSATQSINELLEGLKEIENAK